MPNKRIRSAKKEEDGWVADRVAAYHKRAEETHKELIDTMAELAQQIIKEWDGQEECLKIQKKCIDKYYRAIVGAGMPEKVFQTIFSQLGGSGHICVYIYRAAEEEAKLSGADLFQPLHSIDGISNVDINSVGSSGDALYKIEFDVSI